MAATDAGDQRASFSSYGPEVDLAAPGVEIYSTYKNGTYKTASGTSAATPFVSGLAALLLSRDGTLTPGQVEWQIQATCDDVNATTYPGGDNYLGAGRINAARALGAGSSSPVTVDGTITFDYDKNGNLVKQVINRYNKYFTTTYAYDYENRLTGITYPDDTISTYRYDGGGKRIQTIEDGVATNYLYDGLNAIIEKNEAGVTQAFYNRGLSYGGGIGGIISACRNGTPVYYHYDGIGAVTGLTDVDGKLLQSYSYDAFGNALMTQGQGKGAKNIANPYGFSTKEYNPKSGLSYFGARYYDPAVGRFVTKDPLSWGPDDMRIFAPSAPKALQRGIRFTGTIIPLLSQRYQYCQANPVNMLDPLGLWTFGVGLGGVAGTGMGGTGQVVLVFDDDGNVGLVFTGGYGAYAGLEASYGGIIQYTNADKITDLKELGACKGIGGGFLGGISVEGIAGDGYMGTDVCIGAAGGFAGWGFATWSEVKVFEGWNWRRGIERITGSKANAVAKSR